MMSEQGNFPTRWISYRLQLFLLTVLLKLFEIYYPSFGFPLVIVKNQQGTALRIWNIFIQLEFFCLHHSISRFINHLMEWVLVQTAIHSHLFYMVCFGNFGPVLSHFNKLKIRPTSIKTNQEMERNVERLRAPKNALELGGMGARRGGAPMSGPLVGKKEGR